MIVIKASEVGMRIRRFDNAVEPGDADFVLNSFELEIVQ